MPAHDSGGVDDTDLILQEDDPADLFAPMPQDGVPWRILIVDDDVDVHVVTKFALSNTHFQGRRLSFLHAYSAAEALAMLRDTPDIAMVLLDVIMETPDAGLRLVHQIRHDLHNELVRIVLRTGQPGQNLEHSIIVDYDVNDFWSKADLTTRKLFTTVIASLRAYAALSAAAAERAVLTAELARAQRLQAVIDQHALILTLDARGNIVDANASACRLAGKEREALIGRNLRTLLPTPFPDTLAEHITTALARDGGWAGDLALPAADGSTHTYRCAALAFKDSRGQPFQYVAVGTLADGSGGA